MKKMLRAGIFFIIYYGAVAMEERQTVLTAESLLQRQDQLLHLDNCRTVHAFLPPFSTPIAELSSYRSALQTMLTSPQHASCASCYLCHLHLQEGHLEAHTPAFIYATRALLMFPKLAPALSCIAALYLRQNNILRAIFYAELAYLLHESQYIIYDDIGNSDHHLHIHLQTTDDSLNRIQQLLTCREKIAEIEEYAVLSDILSALGNSTTTLLTAYLDHLHLLPRPLVGPSLAAYEAFLDHLEGAEEMCARARQGDEQTMRALHVFPAYSPDIQWPSDKTLIIFSYVQIDNVLNTFGENNMGLSDALEKLGTCMNMLLFILSVVW